MAESVIGLYKRECARHDGPFRTVDELELATLDWVDWFNHDRLHGELGRVPPIEFEEQHYRQINPQQQREPGEVCAGRSHRGSWRTRWRRGRGVGVVGVRGRVGVVPVLNLTKV